MKITITRALAEIKTLTSRYEKAIRNLDIIAVKQGSKLIGRNSHYKEEDFIKKARSSNDSVIGLYNRLISIKTEIDKSNSTVQVTVGGQTMTVQEALVMKKYLPMREEYLEKLKTLYIEFTRLFNLAEEENKGAVEKLISGTLNKDMAEAQKEAARKDAESYIEKTRALGIVDPCELSELIEKTEDAITTFKTNIDYVLSESNSTTYIEIPD